jgi:inosine-uridine nucleoside N-ribohydrolase
MARRQLLVGLSLAAAALATPGLAAITPRQRIIIDNDFGGDPDGLFQLAHHLASPSVEIALIVGSHLHDKDPFDPAPGQADRAAERARQIVTLAGVGHSPKIVAGGNVALDAAMKPTPASAHIVAEAMREDTRQPLFYVAGASLTELAAAHKLEPRIGKRLKLVWIGGMEHDDLWPGRPVRHDPEYNMTIDAAAARYIFNDSDIEIWQVPRDAYRQMLISHAELEQGLAPAGKLGAYLLERIDAIVTMAGRGGFNIGETYILGDSPLVTLTALQSSFEADSSSSDYVLRPTPLMDEKGRYTPRPQARPMRVYKTIDTRLTFADMFAKLAHLAQH